MSIHKSIITRAPQESENHTVLEDRTSLISITKKRRTSVWDTQPSKEKMNYWRVVPTFVSRPYGFHLEKLQVYVYTGFSEGVLKDRGMNCVIAPYPKNLTRERAVQHAKQSLANHLQSLEFQLKVDDKDYDDDIDLDSEKTLREKRTIREHYLKQWPTSMSIENIATTICYEDGYLHAWTDVGKPTLELKNKGNWMKNSKHEENPAYDRSLRAWKNLCSNRTIEPTVLEFGYEELEQNYMARCTGKDCAIALRMADVANVTYNRENDTYTIKRRDNKKLQTEEVLSANDTYLLKRPNTERGRWAAVDMTMLNQLYEVDESTISSLKEIVH